MHALMVAISAFFCAIGIAVGLAVGYVRAALHPAAETKIVYCHGEAECRRLERAELQRTLPSPSRSAESR